MHQPKDDPLKGSGAILQEITYAWIRKLRSKVGMAFLHTTVRDSVGEIVLFCPIMFSFSGLEGLVTRVEGTGVRGVGGKKCSTEPKAMADG